MKSVLKTSEAGLFSRQNLRGWNLVFLLAFLFHFCCCLIGWNHSLLEHHSYRQTQTAIAVEYMIRDHAWINYITPVLGPPWQVPFEFPLYQMIVAVFCLLLQTPIDQTGRAISLIFFYASFWPINLFLKQFVPERGLRLMMMSLIFFAPLYIYFSRCVMMESTAFFLGFWFLALSGRQLIRPTAAGMAAMLFCGVLCALVKITTFCAFAFPGLIFLILNPPVSDWKKALLRIFLVLTPAYLIPICAGVAWAAREDRIKIASPATEPLASSAINSWVFGSLAQRLDFQFWVDFSARISFGLTFWPLLVLALGILFFVKNRDRLLVGLLLFSGILPGLIFFNLYAVHDYYFYASSIFVIFAVGYLLACLIRKEIKWGKLLWVALSASFIGMYGAFLLPQQWQEDKETMEVIQTIRKNTNEGDYLLIYGEVWNSRIPYYSDRKAFMNFYLDRERILQFDTTLDKIEDWEKIRLAVVNENEVKMLPYIKDKLKARGFSESPDFVLNGFSIFRKTESKPATISHSP